MQTSSRLNVVRSFAKKRIAAKQPKLSAAISISSSTNAISQKMPLPELLSLNGISKREGIEILSKQATAVTACSGTSKRKYHLISIKKLLTGHDSDRDKDRDDSLSRLKIHMCIGQVGNQLDRRRDRKLRRRPLSATRSLATRINRLQESGPSSAPTQSPMSLPPCLKKQH